MPKCESCGKSVDVGPAGDTYRNLFRVGGINVCYGCKEKERREADARSDFYAEKHKLKHYSGNRGTYKKPVTWQEQRQIEKEKSLKAFEKLNERMKVR